MSPTTQAITSGYVTADGCPQPYLQRIREAGFAHVHWCHHWGTDFMYDDGEIDQIARWMDDLGLKFNGVHGSRGQEKAWGSPRRYEREAGVALVGNRIDLAARLQCDVVVMHIPPLPAEGDSLDGYWDLWARSLDALEPHARRRGVRIALENSPGDNMDIIEDAFGRYGGEFLGLCYDCGHGSMAGNGLDRLADNADRLISVHLHDNDGLADLHRLPFTGVAEWDRLASIIATSGCQKTALTLECTMKNSPIADEAEFLTAAAAAAERFDAMIDGYRGAS